MKRSIGVLATVGLLVLWWIIFLLAGYAVLVVVESVVFTPGFYQPASGAVLVFALCLALLAALSAVLRRI